MRHNSTIPVCVFILLICAGQVYGKNNLVPNSSGLCFLENKGQIRDQYNGVRNDVQFVLQAPGLSIFIGDGQLHYQFSHSDVEEGCWTVNKSSGQNFPGEFDALGSHAINFATYRMDVALMGASKKAVAVVGNPQPYYENYYLPGCGENGIQVHAFNSITYKNVYPGIDWVIYLKGNKLEHEFIVGPEGNASDIKLKYDGQTSLNVNTDGSIVATTPMGTITENAPVCYGADGKQIPSSFRLEKNILSYEVNDYKGALVIDPPLEWGTYYGPDTSTSTVYAIACDNAQQVYAGGLTYSKVAGSIATTGSFQYTFGGGNTDAYLVKFDSSGHRLWATYYGGTGDDWASAVTCDRFGNIYLAGSSASTSGMATPGAQQTVYGGGQWGGFLAKFTPSGSREWSTYVGGTVGANFDLEVASVVCDSYGHVYVSGATDDSANIGTPGTFRPYKHESYDTTIEDFLIQYDTARGLRNWGTYYGGPNMNITTTGASCTDGLNMYLSGWTNDTFANSISSPGSYQVAMKGGTDAFVAKFDTFGARTWGTYYGGEGREVAGGVACDTANGLYLLGTTASDTGMATPGCAQPLRSGVADAFLAKFDKVTGMRIWGTYFGGPGVEDVGSSRIITDTANVYITGITASTSGIASPGAWQTVYGGGDDDAFLAAYDFSGKQQWSTYYGGNAHDAGLGVAFDGYGVYLCGETNSSNKIATTGSFEPVGGDTAGYYYPGFVAKFATPGKSILSVVNLNQQANGKINIYPSPNRGSFTLTGSFENMDGIAKITITDVAGNLVLTSEGVISSGMMNRNIDLDSNVPPGVYLLKTCVQANQYVLKFVKE